MKTGFIKIDFDVHFPIQSSELKKYVPNSIFSDFFQQLLELCECRRGEPYWTANRNFARLAH